MHINYVGIVYMYVLAQFMIHLSFLSALSPRKFSLGEDELLQTARAKGTCKCVCAYVCTLHIHIISCNLVSVKVKTH